jgi:uncharacterized phage protein (TIGR02220 family)
MSLKETKRKGFNFFRSYYDVYNELPKDQKLEFIDALLHKQFLGKEPEGLKGMAKFAWISQMNSIDSQVKGWEDKTGLKLTLSHPPTDGGRQGGYDTPTLQVEEKGKVNTNKSELKNSDDSDKTIKNLKKESLLDFDKLLKYFNNETGKNCRVISDKVKKKINMRLKEGYTKDDIGATIKNGCKDDFHVESALKYFTLEYISRSDTIDKYSVLKKEENIIKLNMNT